MKKFLFLIALFALMGGVNSYATKKYATYGTPASEGSWNAETGTYTWTQSYSNLMPIFEFPNGELADYKSLHLTTSDYTDTYRICFMNGGTLVATIAFYSAGQKDLVFSERTETKDLDLSKITHISFGGASGSGSITITKKPYLQKPFSLDINDNGKAVVDVTDLVASGCLSLNDETGVLTSTLGEEGAPTWGRLSINFPAEGVDLSALTGFSVDQSGTVLFNNFEIGSKGFWSNVMGRSDLATYVKDFGDPTSVNTWRWNVNSAGTQTINSITLDFSSITASNPHETFLTAAMFNDPYCEYNIGKSQGQGATIYGNGSVVADKYVDLSAYDEMRVYGTPNKKIRLLFNWTSANQKEITGDDVKLNAEGYYSLDLSTVAPQQLNAFKFPYDGQNGTITKVILYKNTIPVPYNYAISGTGAKTPSLTAALADASATSYDATGVTGTGVDLTSVVNKNALFVANAGVLSNTSNVIVNDACANLALTDGNYPFKAPADFTATNVSYNRNFTAGIRSTVCLPFALTAAEAEAAGTFYELSGVNVAGTELTFEAVSGGTTAYKPYIFEAKADGTPFSAYSGKSIAATPTSFTGETVVGYTLTGVLAGSSDVAADNEGKTVYGWSGNSGSEGTFVKVGSGVAIDPFRAYVVYNGTGGTSPARMAARFIGGSITGIDEVPEIQEFLNPDGKYIENGKIVIVKNGVKYNAAGQQVK